ncbi:MAG: DUF192 domain-containing protein, partial [Thiohalobacterales bacterium]|nr:DUF192 domain-containing protein [Thiohalobacterales bacterium]
MRPVRWGSMLLVCQVLMALSCSMPAQACPVRNAELEITAKGHALTVELATHLAGHMCGLAFRQSLPADHGMLFAYAHDQTIGFWMKNTLIDLSIAFLDASGRILEIHDMDADDPDRRYISGSPARYALETNRGWFREHG